MATKEYRQYPGVFDHELIYEFICPICQGAHVRAMDPALKEFVDKSTGLPEFAEDIKWSEFAIGICLSCDFVGNIMNFEVLSSTCEYDDCDDCDYDGTFEENM